MVLFSIFRASSGCRNGSHVTTLLCIPPLFLSTSVMTSGPLTQSKVTALFQDPSPHHTYWVCFVVESDTSPAYRGCYSVYPDPQWFVSILSICKMCSPLLDISKRLNPWCHSLRFWNITQRPWSDSGRGEQSMAIPDAPNLVWSLKERVSFWDTVLLCLWTCESKDKLHFQNIMVWTSVGHHLWTFPLKTEQMETAKESSVWSTSRTPLGFKAREQAFVTPYSTL